MVNSLGLLMAVFAIIIGVFIFLYFVPINLWITAIFSGVRVGLLELVFMRIRKVPPSIIVNQLITATKAGLSIEDDQSKTKRNMKSSDLFKAIFIIVTSRLFRAFYDVHINRLVQERSMNQRLVK